MIHRRPATTTALIGSLFFATLSGRSQVRLEIRIVNAQTLRTQQILKGEQRGTQTVIAEELGIPQSEGRLAAVVLLHGSGGLGRRPTTWAEDLSATGIAVFLLDNFSARGIISAVNDQTQLDHLAMMVDAYSALGMLAQHPRIDPNRVAVMDGQRGQRRLFMRAWSGFGAHTLHRLRFRSGSTDELRVIQVDVGPRCSSVHVPGVLSETSGRRRALVLRLRTSR